MLLLIFPDQVVVTLTQNFDHAVFANDCCAEAVHIVILAVEPFSTHPYALAISIFIFPDDNGYINLRS